MGVSGSGKNTVGELLARKLELPFYDADDYHPEVNIRKMNEGKPLDDSDREPWLKKLSSEIRNWIDSGGAILACSALKESYRKLLENGNEGIQWIVLRGSHDLIYDRIKKRADHFFSSELLQSQFDTFEVPEYGYHLQVEESPSILADRVFSLIGLQESGRIGLIGLGTMGKQLCRNLLRNGFKLAVYNQDEGEEKGTVNAFVSKYSNEGKLRGYTDYRSFVQSLESPRIILLMVKAGEVVDLVIEGLMSYLEAEDVIIDAGNSFFKDTERRQRYLKENGIELIGMGVSGGASGALNGPSFMPGGDDNCIDMVYPLLQITAAKDNDGKACVTSVGPGGSGHYIKMVHNGIEYAEMQLIAEIYSYLRQGMSNEEIGKIFKEWSHGESDSFLLGISHKIIFKKNSPQEFLIDTISDKAGSKGTGNWAVESASELGFPASMIMAAVNFRMISNMKNIPDRFSRDLNQDPREGELMDIGSLYKTFHWARIINHHQGFELLRMASEEYNWKLELAEIARIWTNGCIIRSALMERCAEKLKTGAILNDPSNFKWLVEAEKEVIEFITDSAEKRIAIPCFSSAYNFWLAITAKNLPTNLVQAQRDFFGGHGFYRKDDPHGEIERLNWDD